MPGIELLGLIGIIVVALAITTAVALTMRRRLGRHRSLAVLIAGLSAPALGIAATAALNWRDHDVPGDGPAMAMVGTISLAAFVLPFTLLLSALLLRRR